MLVVGRARRRWRRVVLLLLALLALFVLISSAWLPRSGGGGECGGGGGGGGRQPCWRSAPQTQRSAVVGQEEGAGPGLAPPLIQDCPGQSFQASRLLRFLRSSLPDGEDDVLLEPYLHGWDQLIMFMESLGTMVSFFSQKVKEKVALIRELSLKRDAEDPGKRGPPPESPQRAYRSARSMAGAELKAGLVDFSRRSDSGCRTLLRLHRSLLWLQLVLEGLAQGPDASGRLKTPGELGREAYRVALAPHHPWVLRQAAELAFVALPDRKYFLELVCVRNQHEAAPVLRVIIGALAAVHARTQRILEQHGMLELP